MSAPALIAIALCLSQPAPGGGALPPLPDVIHLKTMEETFSRRYDYALRDGRIYWKLRQPELGAPAPHWALLGPAGLPFQESGPRDDDPKRIVAISADSTGLVAIADDNRIVDLQIDDLGKGKYLWFFTWGFPYRVLPSKVYLPREHRAWTYSLLNLNSTRWSEDMDGNPHTILAVDSVFLVPPDGRSLWFNDPWLPPNTFDFRIAGPERGAFAAVNISASGSLVMVIDRRGRMYTRLVDFDSIGGNPGLNYSYERQHFGNPAVGPLAYFRSILPFFFDVPRSVPADPWHRQPDITEGKLTDRITVVQTGDGNSSRELRVQGTDAGGATGYWHKMLRADHWVFRATGQAIDRPFLDPQAPPEVTDSTDERCEGTAELARPGFEVSAPRAIRMGPAAASAPETVPAVLTGFNVGWDPARIELPAGSGQLVTLHLKPWTDAVKPGAPIRLMGVLELARTDSDAPAEEAASRARLKALLGGRRLRPVFVYVTDPEIRVEPDPFGAIGGPGFVMRFARTAKR